MEFADAMNAVIGHEEITKALMPLVERWGWKTVNDVMFMDPLWNLHDREAYQPESQ